MNKDTTIMILAAGKVPQEFSSVFGDLPSALVPVNNRPAIFWTIEKFINDGFNKFIICVGYKKNKVKSFVENNFGEKANIDFVDVDFRKKPGSSFMSGLERIKTKKLLVILGDTFIYNKVVLEDDFILTSKNFLKEESYRWALVVDKDGYVDKIFDKKKNVPDDKNLKLIIGVYYFSNVRLLKKCTNLFKNQNIEISEIIKKYNKFKKMKVVDYDDWFDFGHLDKYYSSEKKLLSYKTRYFNFLDYNDVFGFITKKSQEEKKLNNEIDWYLSIPKELSILTPRLVNYKKGKKPFLSLEYYSYQTLSELYVFGEVNEYVWKNVIDRIIRILNIFQKHRGKVTMDEYYKIYFEKLESRINQLLESNKKFKNMFKMDQILINDKKYLNYNVLKKDIFSKVKELYSEKDNCFLHGDFCFSNILYDVKSGIIRLIDPRGKWADSSFGDIKYDIAKLRHSIVGQYDFIVNNLFSVKIKDNNIKYKIFNNKRYFFLSDYFDNKIKEHWSLNNIKFIEGLLFLSMLPLHNDYFDRQLVMYAIGIQRINEVLNNKNRTL